MSDDNRDASPDKADDSVIQPPLTSNLEKQLSDLAGLLKHDSGFLDKLSRPVIGRYEVRELLGDNRQAIVYRAYDIELDRQVVLKIDATGNETTFRDQLRREGQALCQIDIPQVVRCIAVEEVDGVSFLVLEYIDGVNVEELRQHANLESPRMIEIVLDVIAGLRAVHTRGLLHLDLKPRNIMIAASGMARLVDFGLAQPVGSVSKNELAGTLAFMAPEVANLHKTQVDFRTDIFGVGAVLYFLLTGKAPFEDSNRHKMLTAARSCKFIPAAKLNSDAFPELNRICTRCMSFEAHHRYDTLQELESELRQLQVVPADDRGAAWQSPRSLALFAGTAAIVASLLMYPWNRLSEDSGAMRVPSPEAVSRVDFGQLPAEFKIEVTMQYVQNEMIAGEVSRNMGIWQIDTDSEIRVAITPSRRCWMALFNYEAVDESPRLTRQLVYPGEENEPFRFASGDALELDLTPTPTSSGVTEYLLVVAFSSKWNPDDVREVDVLSREVVEAVKKEFRGLSVKNDKLSMQLIPYRCLSRHLLSSPE